MESQPENTPSIPSETVNSEPSSTEQAPSNNNNTSQTIYDKLGVFLFFSLLWALAINYFGREFTTSHPWFVFLGIVLFSIPIILNGLYLTTVKKIRILAGFTNRGRLHRIFSGRILSTILWSIWAPITTFFFLMQFRTYSIWEWGAFFLVIPLFWVVYQISRMVAGSEMKSYLVSAGAVKAALLITPVLAFIIYLVTLFYLGDPPQFDSLSDSIASNKEGITNEMTRSAIVFELAQWQAYYDGAKDFTFGRLGETEATLAILLFSLGGFVVFFNACSMLSCFLIPKHEYRRIFTSLSEVDEPSPLEPWRIATSTGIFTIVLLFVLLPLFTELESLFKKHHDSFSERRGQIDVLVIQIDDNYYPPETKQEIQDIQIEILKKFEDVIPELNRELELAFQQMEGNTDLFLDWYYTLTSEYLRTLNLLMGNAETYIAQELEKHLNKNEPFKNFDLKVQEILELQESVNEQYTKDIRALLERNRVEPPESQNIVLVERLSLSDVLSPPTHKDTIDLEKRLGISGTAGGAAGLASAVVVKKVITKVSTKGAFKAAAKAIAKFLGSKAASTAGGGAAGAATGAVIGSFFPGFGTIAGAIIGGISGVIVGVSVDKGMLMLEEAVSREDFKEEILSGIRSARTEYMAKLEIK